MLLIYIAYIGLLWAFQILEYYEYKRRSKVQKYCERSKFLIVIMIAWLFIVSIIFLTLPL